MQCKYCDRNLDTHDCKLREAVPELEGCDGYGIYSRSLINKQKEKEKAAEEAHAAQSARNLEWLENIQAGDEVRLKASPKTMYATRNLPLYLEKGTFKVLGIHKNGKVICDWDGGKPFLIPGDALDLVKKRGE